MIHINTIVLVSDNSGAIIGKTLSCVKNCVGSIITITVKKCRFKKVKFSKRIIRKQILRACLVRCAFRFKRWSNFYFKGSTNSVVVINIYKLPYATRIFGFIFNELRTNENFRKIITMVKAII